MNTPQEVISAASRGAGSGASSAFTGNGACALIVNVTSLDQGASVTVVLKSSTGTELVRTAAPIDRPASYSLAWGEGHGVPGVNAQAGQAFTKAEQGKATIGGEAEGGWPEHGSDALPSQYEAHYVVAGGNATFGVDAVVAQ